MITALREIPGPCPCHSGKTYQLCCAVIHEDQRRAEYPEQLMRARYCAYVLHIKDFLLNSWAFESRPDQFQFDPAAKWISLEIIDAGPVLAKTMKATVTFTAQYIGSKKLWTLHEQSQFIKRSQRWFYLDGTASFSQKNIGGNAGCPCGSGKKFKRCCI